MADRRLRDLLPLLERQELYFQNYPRPHAIFYFARGLFFDVTLEEASTKLASFCWYEPDEIREVLAPILDKQPPAASIAPFSQAPATLLTDVADAERRARQLDAELAEGTRAIKGTWWTKPLLMRGRDGWLALEFEKRRLNRVARWDAVDVRTELTRVVVQDHMARTEPVDAKLRSRVLELENMAEAQLNQLLDGGHRWEGNAADSKISYVRHRNEYVGVLQDKSAVYELFWASRLYVVNKMFEAAVAGKPGRVKSVEPELRHELSEKADRSSYMRLMRAGKLKVGDVPYQTDSEWWLYFKRGKFWNRSGGMDEEAYEVSQREAAAILRDRAYTFVSFES